MRDGETSTIEVAVGDARPIRGVQVHVDIRHTYVGDLVVKLVPPAGQGGESVVLHHKDEGGNAHDLIESYDRTRVAELADLEGKSLPGTWTLEVSDVYHQDQGAIRSFSLEFVF